MISYRTRTVTPDNAREILKKNTGNRTIREAWVEQLAGLIKAGKWAETHQGIAIAKGGRVLDGQHRLHAIVRSGMAVDIMVATGLDEDVYRWIDGGKTRTFADRIHLVDNPEINRICCSLVNNYKKCSGSSKTPSVDEIENTFLEMSDAFLYVGSAFVKTVKLITVMPVGAALVSFHHAHPDKAVEACEHLLTGHMMDDGHPILVLREALRAQRLRSLHEQYWKAISAFRAFHDSRTIGKLLESTKDFQGHIYDRLKWERQAVHLKGAVTRKATKVVA